MTSLPFVDQILLAPFTAEKKTDRRVRKLIMWTAWLNERTKISGEALQLCGDSI